MKVLFVLFLALNVNAAEPAKNVDDIDLSALSDAAATPETVLKDELGSKGETPAVAAAVMDVPPSAQVVEATKKFKRI